MAITQIIIQGVLTGLLLTISFGAGFFALIQTSITKGFRKGLMIATGAIISDFLFILFAVFATSFISEELVKYDRAIKFVALVSFMVLGIRTILKSSKIVAGGDQSSRPLYYYITKGFLLNCINPLILLTWIGISVFLESNLRYTQSELAIYFSSVLTSTYLTQAGICFFSHSIKNHLSELLIHRINIFIGVLFIGIGLFLFFGSDQTNEGIEKAREILQ